MQRKTQQNKTTLVQSLVTTLGQEMRRAYFTMLPSPHKALENKRSKVKGGLQKCRSNIHLLEYHSTEWRFERLISQHISLGLS